MQCPTRHAVRGAVAALAAVLLAAVPPAAAQLCQTPLSIQKGDVDANIMILLDNSGSMNEVIEHDAYDPDTAWDGGFVGTATYMVYTSGWYTINSRNAFLVAAPNGEPGRYFGNYLNWVFWTADADQRAALPQLTKLDVAQEVIKGFVDRTTDVFIGLSVFDYDTGARILAECGEEPAVIKSRVDAVAGTAWTPLGEAMEDLLDYFRRTDDDAPIQYDCQQSFIIVVTDGLPTHDRDVSPYLWDADGDGNDPGDCTSIGAPYDDDLGCSDHVDDVAYWARHNDLIDWLGEPDEAWEDGQTVVTYTIGYDVDHPLLAETAANGDGLYLSASDAAELWASLETIMVNVRQRVAAGSAVAVVSSESADTDWLFRGKYKPTQWMGFVECFAQPYRDRLLPL
ncbi:MAG TPA: hypothetical protein PLQ13_07865, partial [Candidatus Krumholzibacteria bacterium]|nr:hypothetical protein [Candidatus Krumholzibacteria bacterium]